MHIKNWFRKAKTDSSIVFCPGEDSLSLVCLKGGSVVDVVHQESLDIQNEKNLQSKLQTLIKRFNLTASHASLVLPPEMYQLLMMDNIDVPQAELAQALRWRLKGLTDYPLNDIAVDVFLVPPHGVGQQRKKVFVAVTIQSQLQKLLSYFESAYVQIDSVTIADLALKNLVYLNASLRDFSGTSIFIHADKGRYYIHIYFDKALYLVRKFHLNQNEANKEEKLLLEIQRSQDYCLSELKLESPRKILFSPVFVNEISLVDYCQAQLDIEVEQVSLASLFEVKQPWMTKQLLANLYALGAQALLEKQEVN